MFAVLLYVAADFANPLMPGAVCFDPDESVDGVGRARSLPLDVAPVLTALASARSIPAQVPPPSLSRVRIFAHALAVCPAPRARAALPLLSDRSSDDA